MGFMMEGLSETAINDLIYRYGPAMWHGTDLHVVPSLIQNGLIPGGGPGGRLGVHYVLGHCPTQWEDGSDLHSRSPVGGPAGRRSAYLFGSGWGGSHWPD